MSKKPSPTFRKSIAAIKRLADSESETDDLLWPAAYAVLEECGAPGKDGVNNESNAKIQQLAKQLKEAGLDKSRDWILKARRVAHAFPPARRLSGVGFWVHEAAGKRDTLVAARAEAKREGVKLTVKFVKGFKARRHQEEQQHRREEDSRLNGHNGPDREAEKSVDEVLAGLNDIAEILTGTVLAKIAKYRERYRVDDCDRIQSAWHALEQRISNSNPHLDRVELREQ